MPLRESLSLPDISVVAAHMRPYGVFDCAFLWCNCDVNNFALKLVCNAHSPHLYPACISSLICVSGILEVGSFFSGSILRYCLFLVYYSGSFTYPSLLIKRFFKTCYIGNMHLLVQDLHFMKKIWIDSCAKEQEMSIMQIILKSIVAALLI